MMEIVSDDEVEPTDPHKLPTLPLKPPRLGDFSQIFSESANAYRFKKPPDPVPDPVPKEKKLGDFSQVFTFLQATSSVSSKSCAGPPDSALGARRVSCETITTPPGSTSPDKFSDLGSDATSETLVESPTPRTPEITTLDAITTPETTILDAVTTPVPRNVESRTQHGQSASKPRVGKRSKADKRRSPSFLFGGPHAKPVEVRFESLLAKLQREVQLDVFLQKKYPKRLLTTHVFIDMSNIYIGFNDSFKCSLGIPDYARTPLAPFDFPALAKILERGRIMGVREIAGSAADPENTAELPEYFHAAKALGYETSILRRVLKPVKAYRGQKPSASSSSDSSSPESSDCCGVPQREFCYGEQGVDEILQLKMGNTAMAHLEEPGIMVLATGDAEKAEYSDGFQKQVERILTMGWFVEVVSWKRGLSNSWTRLDWTQKWAGRFRIVLLDDYLEELLDT